MPTVVAPRLPARWRRTGVVAGLLVLLAVLLLSHRFGRAVPTNNYRPLITTDAIATGCYPLPGDARLDLPYQIRRDEDVATATGQRRSLQGQYDLVDRDEAEQRLVSSFEAVGFRPTGGPGGEITLTKGAERIGLSVKELPDTSAATLVRGTFVIDLPVVARAKDAPVCGFPSSTKRWAEPRESKR